MKRRILIIGKVHEVGYRAFLLGLAESFEVKNFFAENLTINGKQAVEVLVEDEEIKVKDFIDSLKKRKPDAAEVEEIKVEDYQGKVMKKESYYRYLTAMQLTKIATYGGEMIKRQDETLEKQDQMLKKQDQMLEKQDQMLKKQDQMLKKQDQTIKEIRVTREEIKGEISALRQDLKTYLDKRIVKIEKEIAKIKARIGMSN